MSAGARARRSFPLQLGQLGTAGEVRRSSAAALVLAPAATPARIVLRPQAPLHHASVVRLATASGLGLDSCDVRRRMVERLRAGGVRDERVLEALRTVPRHHFVDAALATQAYEDTSLPIGHGQTISRPSVVARMTELLMAGAAARAGGRLGRVLEIGTGCGYQAAVLAQLSRSVISVERVKPLHDKARRLMAPTRGANVRLVYADGNDGHAPNAPYDSIVAAAACDEVPAAWLAQLALGGRLVAPIGDRGGRHALLVIDRTADGYQRHWHEAVHFVPLKSGVVG